VDEQGGAIAELCRRLEGIPLAIELAAAQVRVLPPAEILERLSAPRGVRSALDETLDESFGLIDAEARALGLRASVFRGGFTLEALEAVGGDGADVLAALTTLVESSLVRRLDVGGARRFSMLETIRAYGLERLAESGELEGARDRHAAFFADLAENAGAALRRRGHEQTLAELDAEAGNVRAALDRLLERGQLDRVVSAAWALLPHVILRERLQEGRRWFSEARRHGAGGPRALAGEGALALWASDYPAAAELATGARSLAAGDDEALAVAELVLGSLETMRGAEHGVSMLEACSGRFREIHDDWGESLAAVGIAWGLNAAEADVPLELYETAVENAAGLGFELETLAIGALGRRLALAGRAGDAKRVLSEALERTTALAADLGTAIYVDVLADLAAAEGEAALASRLSGAAEAGAEGAEASLPPLSGDRATRLSGLRERLGEDAFSAAVEAGRATPLEDAAAEALAFARPPSASPGPRGDGRRRG
jgi:hypothetical protein